MPEVQKGSKKFVIFAKPRIGGLVKTQTQIKNDFSNFYVDDSTTPLTWTLEFTDSKGNVTTLAFDGAKSTDTTLYFLPTNTFWDTLESYTILLFWEVGTDLEKIYADEAIYLVVKNFHDGP